MFRSPFAFRMVEKKREAEAAIDLMTVQYERTRGDEERRNGLIIEKAIYGHIENDRIIEGLSTLFIVRLSTKSNLIRFFSSNLDTSNASTTAAQHDQFIDVTIPLQCLVKDSKLILHNLNKVICLLEPFLL